MNKSMKNKFASVLGTTILIFFVLINLQPIISYAQGSGETSGGNYSNVNNIIRLDNPLGDRINNLPAFIYMVLGIVFRIGAVLSVLALMYVGFMFVSARGVPENLETARRAFLYTVIGIAVLLGGVLIASVIQNTVIDVSRGVI